MAADLTAGLARRRGGRPFAAPALALEALQVAVRGALARETAAGVLRAARLDRSRGPALVATPRDFRPNQPEIGRAILSGRYLLAGAELDVGPGGDPWDRPSPSRAFAAALHQFEWLPDLLACGEPGAREALRLFLDWRRLFFRPNRFVWNGATLERRLYNLACGAKRMGSVASDHEASTLFKALAHQARYLRRLDMAPERRVERCAIPALATAALKGRGVARFAAERLDRLAKTLPSTILADGGTRSRCPEEGMELLFDLMTLDDVLLQRGRETPLAIGRAIDRLSSALPFFTLGDGRLASFQGGEAADPERVRAATGQDDADGGRPGTQAPYSGYQRLCGPTLQVMVDAAAPAVGGWSHAACAQPLAIEVVGGADRLFANSGWSPRAEGEAASRLAQGANTAELDGRSVGRILDGVFAAALGPRLIEGAGEVAVQRQESEAGVWLELAHDGWARPFGLVHTRRLYLDARADELRGEDVFSAAPGRRRTPAAVTFAVRFHAHPDVQLSLARDGRSVLLRGASDRGWWFRNDAAEIALEPSVVFERGRPRRTVQVALKGPVSPDGAARVRWKLTPVETAPKLRLRSKAAAAATQTPPLAPLADFDAPVNETPAAADAEVMADPDVAPPPAVPDQSGST